MLQTDLVYMWRSCNGFYDRFIDDLFKTANERYVVDAHGFSRYDALAPYDAKVANPERGKRELFTGPFLRPLGIANQMGMGIEEALRKMEIPLKMMYKPCLSLVYPPSDFVPAQIKRWRWWNTV